MQLRWKRLTLRSELHVLLSWIVIVSYMMLMRDLLAIAKFFPNCCSRFICSCSSSRHVRVAPCEKILGPPLQRDRETCR